MSARRTVDWPAATSVEAARAGTAECAASTATDRRRLTGNWPIRMLVPVASTTVAYSASTVNRSCGNPPKRDGPMPLSGAQLPNPPRFAVHDFFLNGYPHVPSAAEEHRHGRQVRQSAGLAHGNGALARRHRGDGGGCLCPPAAALPCPVRGPGDPRRGFSLRRGGRVHAARERLRPARPVSGNRAAVPLGGRPRADAQHDLALPAADSRLLGRARG